MLPSCRGYLKSLVLNFRPRYCNDSRHHEKISKALFHPVRCVPKTVSQTCTVLLLERLDSNEHLLLVETVLILRVLDLFWSRHQMRRLTRQNPKLVLFAMLKMARREERPRTRPLLLRVKK